MNTQNNKRILKIENPMTESEFEEYLCRMMIRAFLFENKIMILEKKDFKYCHGLDMVVANSALKQIKEMEKQSNIKYDNVVIIRLEDIQFFHYAIVPILKGA